MSKDEARAILEDWIDTLSQDNLGEHKKLWLPSEDCIVFTKNVDSIITDWTFKGLIKIAYDL